MSPIDNHYQGQSDVDAAILTELRLFRDEVRDDVAEIKSDIRNLMVTRREWELRNTHVDNKFQSQGREIGQLRTEIAARRHPWPAVAAAILAGCALGWTILGPIITGG